MSKTELFVTAVNDWNVFMNIEWRSMLFTNAIEELIIMIIIIMMIIIIIIIIIIIKMIITVVIMR